MLLHRNQETLKHFFEPLYQPLGKDNFSQSENMVWKGDGHLE